MELYQQILRGAFAFPPYVGKSAKDLVAKLLMEKPAMRLGIVKRGHRELITHAFFKLIDVAALPKRAGKPPPPHVPRIAHETDMSNFDLDGATGEPQDPAWARPVSAAEQKLFEGYSL